MASPSLSYSADHQCSLLGGPSGDCAQVALAFVALGTLWWKRYFVAFAVDTSLGVAIAVGLHTLVVRLCRHRAAALPASPWAAWCLHVAECGSYGTPPQWRRFGLQLVEWTGCVIIARLVCGSIVIGLQQPLGGLASLIDRGFGRHMTLELVFVMLVCPLGMNLLQALLQDMVLKRKHAAAAATAKQGAMEAVMADGRVLSQQHLLHTITADRQGGAPA